ncbi:hypothetical protein [Nocardia implantans]|uniref:Ferredoxin n=1 Tax=Nocardia implantans TaxID=3108168 RepID=A0ABU6ASF4_9NOCA|nr:MULTISPECIES: hypothetical protein [unclassified Nocardia]MBF6191836.1 hypothetical protein [Nocardia beijingensis]MEA3527852.1 hypothetical protein [Nocardia sp. CDC192]MEB3510396.1 hypothetical protein [Nocardia sp. CDC186]
MERVTCRTCGTCVLVEKFSPQHTSVQWNAGAVAACAEFAGADGARVRTCAALRESIDAAVADGLVEVSTRDGDVP